MRSCPGRSRPITCNGKRARLLAIELGEWGIRANAIAPGAVEGDRIERVFAGRAQISGRSVEEVRAEAMAAQSIKAMIDPKDIAALAVFFGLRRGQVDQRPGVADRQ
jgi:NAD(P)-dependent dehydrogenase (short-subunit alcohol dehydrogenase family)